MTLFMVPFSPPVLNQMHLGCDSYQKDTHNARNPDASAGETDAQAFVSVSFLR